MRLKQKTKKGQLQLSCIFQALNITCRIKFHFEFFEITNNGLHNLLYVLVALKISEFVAYLSGGEGSMFPHFVIWTVLSSTDRRPLELMSW